MLHRHTAELLESERSRAHPTAEFSGEELRVRMPGEAFQIDPDYVYQYLAAGPIRFTRELDDERDKVFAFFDPEDEGRVSLKRLHVETEGAGRTFSVDVIDGKVVNFKEVEKQEIKDEKGNTIVVSKVTRETTFPYRVGNFTY